jgi:hypothetical protein
MGVQLPLFLEAKRRFQSRPGGGSHAEKGNSFLLLLCPVLTLGKPTGGGLILYDDFDESVIDPNKWVASQNFDPDLRESVRRIESSSEESGRALHLLHRAYSATTDNNGTSGGGFGLSFANPGAVNAVSFGLTVKKVNVTGCPTNPSALAITGAEFRGTFFNINSAPTDASGDVQANISIARNPGGPLFVAGFVSVGFGGPVLGYQTLGTVTEGSKNKLFVQWDQSHHQFIFQLNEGNPVFEPYTVPDTTPPFSPFKSLQVVRVVPHCTSTPRPSAYVDATIDDVFVNR